jgi:Uma2 family endonuclease
MPSLAIDLTPSEEQTEFNLQRWAEILDDPEWQKWPGRVETDRHGNVIMSPPAGFDHASYGFNIGVLLRSLLKGGRALTDCPISTADGVRVADAAWISRERRERIGRRLSLAAAPEICVEVLSPGNSPREMTDKKALYFQAGATEVWFCDGEGRMTFYLTPTSSGSDRSLFCPAFPPEVEQE